MGATGSVIKQTFIDMANLFDIERSKAQATALPAATRNLHLKELKRLKKVEDGAVVDREWFGADGLPSRTPLPPLKEREPIRVEEFASVSRQCGEVVIDSTMYGTKGCQQAWESVVAALQNFFAEPIGSLAKLIVESRNSVVVVIDKVGDREQVPLFSKEEKDQAHHEGES